MHWNDLPKVSGRALWYICILLILLLGIHFMPRSYGQEIGNGLICDTEGQIREYVKLSNEGVPTKIALEKLNATSTACGIATVAYFLGEKVGDTQAKQVKADIVRILVIGLYDGKEWVVGEPMMQFTLFLTKEGVNL